MPPVNIVDASNEQLETPLIKIRKLNINSEPEFAIIGFIQNVIFSLCLELVRKADTLNQSENGGGERNKNFPKN